MFVCLLIQVFAKANVTNKKTVFIQPGFWPRALNRSTCSPEVDSGSWSWGREQTRCYRTEGPLPVGGPAREDVEVLSVGPVDLGEVAEDGALVPGAVPRRRALAHDHLQPNRQRLFTPRPMRAEKTSVGCQNWKYFLFMQTQVRAAQFKVGGNDGHVSGDKFQIKKKT